MFFIIQTHITHSVCWFGCVSVCELWINEEEKNEKSFAIYFLTTFAGYSVN